MKRRQSREIAFELLFEWSFTGLEVEEMIVLAKQAREENVDKFSAGLVACAVEHQQEIDELIEQYSERWKINRISKVTLAALRLAFCELLYYEIPAGATINEAVELVKKYGTEDEASYLNGVLGAYMRDKQASGKEG